MSSTFPDPAYVPLPPAQAAAAQIDAAPLSPATGWLAWRLLHRANARGMVLMTKEDLLALAGTQSMSGARRHLSALAQLGIIAYVTRPFVFLVFSAFLTGHDVAPYLEPMADSASGAQETPPLQAGAQNAGPMPDGLAARGAGEGNPSGEMSRAHPPLPPAQPQPLPQARAVPQPPAPAQPPVPADPLLDSILDVLLGEGVPDTPSVRQRVRRWLDNNPTEWIMPAIDCAVLAGNCTLRYIDGILHNWRAAGRPSGVPGQEPYAGRGASGWQPPAYDPHAATPYSTYNPIAGSHAPRRGGSHDDWYERAARRRQDADDEGEEWGEGDA